MKTALKPLRQLYDWTLSLGQSRYALVALAGLAFLESIIFPLPLEVLLLPMILGARNRIFLFVIVATLFSALGAVVGAALAQSLLPYLGSIPGISDERLLVVQTEFDKYGVWAVAIGALTLLPFKVTVITAGLAKYSLISLFLFSLLFRGLRYGIIGLLLYFFGEPAKAFIDKWFGWLCLLGIVMVAGLVWYLTVGH